MKAGTWNQSAGTEAETNWKTTSFADRIKSVVTFAKEGFRRRTAASWRAFPEDTPAASWGPAEHVQAGVAEPSQGRRPQRQETRCEGSDRGRQRRRGSPRSPTQRSRREAAWGGRRPRPLGESGESPRVPPRGLTPVQGQSPRAPSEPEPVSESPVNPEECICPHPAGSREKQAPGSCNRGTPRSHRRAPRSRPAACSRTAPCRLPLLWGDPLPSSRSRHRRGRPPWPQVCGLGPPARPCTWSQRRGSAGTGFWNSPSSAAESSGG